MAGTARMDELVKDYLLYRGLNASLKTFEVELKNEKDKAFKVDKILDQLTTFINTYDLANLRDYWSYLDQRIFARLEQVYSNSVRKLEVSLFKYYLVNAVQNNRNDKISEFFEKMTPELQNQNEWKDWFVLPFIKNPDENTAFAIYFTRQWQETFLISLHNFLSVIFQSMAVPALLNYEDDHRKLTKLREENDNFRKQLMELVENRGAEISLSITNRSDDDWLPPSSSPARWGGSVDLMDDFSVISQDGDQFDGASIESQPRTNHIRAFMRNIGLPSSPMSGKKNSGPTISTSSSSSSLTQQNSQRQLNNSQQQKSEELKQSNSAGAININAKAKKQNVTISGTPSSSIAVPSRGDDKSKATEETSGRQAMSHTLPKMKPEELTRKEVPSSFSQHSLQAKTSEVTEIATSDPDDLSPFLVLTQEEYGEHRSSVSHCRFSTNGNAVATADVDGVVKVWGFQPAPVTMATVMSKSTLLSIEWASNTDRMILLGNKAGSIRLFDVKEKKTLKEAVVDASCPRITTLCCSPSGEHFVCGAAGKLKPSGSLTGDQRSPSTRVGKLTLWDLSTLKMQKELGMEKSPVSVNCMVFNKSGNLLLTGGSDGVIRLYDMTTQQCRSSWQAHAGEVHTIEFMQDESGCYSQGSDNKFTCWNLHKPGTPTSLLKIHQGAAGPFVLTGAGGYRQVQTAKGKLFAFDTSKSHILTCGPHGGVIYKLDSEGHSISKVLSLRGHRTPVTCVDWSSSLECSRCLTGSMDGKIRVSTLLPK